MRKRELLAVTGALVVIGLATAGAAAPPTPGADLPTTAVERLVATGELPADVTGEPGVWNFVGPASACPGPGWNCVTLGEGPIVQNGTVNVAVAAQCAGASQMGDVNIMQCIHEEYEATVTRQTCGTAALPISQTGPQPHNELICKLIYDVTTTEPTQCVVQEAHFTQSGVTNKFKGQLSIVQRMTGAATQTQDARQRINGTQTGDEWNESEVQEVQIQQMTGTATATQTQNQNTGCPGSDPPQAGDCNSGSTPAVGPTTPYTCINLAQRVAPGGANQSKLKQEVKQEAQTTATAATEMQGQQTGGNDARVHQEVGVVVGTLFVPAETGKNLGLADQFTYQTLPADQPLLVQSQFEDPFCCGGGSQLGGDEEENEETAKQWVQQKANEDAFQRADATGVTASVAGGKCTVTHDLENNGGTVQTSHTDEGAPCAVTGTSGCTGAGGEGGCFSFNCPPGESFNQDTGRCEEEDTSTITAPARASRAL